MKEPLVLVPGLGCTAALFDPQVAALSPSRPVVVADHTLDDSMEAIARRLLASAPSRFALAGLSMGGYVALEVVRQAPERVSRLALLDTNARADSEEASAARRPLIRLAEAGSLSEIHEQLWPHLVAPHRLADAGLKSTIRRMLEDTGPDAFVRQQHAIMGRSDSRNLLRELEVPTLILVGEHDVLTPPEQAREMGDLVEWASLVVVPGCGHLSTLEKPELVTAALEAWLAS